MKKIPANHPTKDCAMRIEIAEIENRGIWRVWYDGAVLIERTTSPMRAAARVLLDRGIVSLDDVLEMTRRGRDQVDMRATVGVAAGPDVRDRLCRRPAVDRTEPAEQTLAL